MGVDGVGLAAFVFTVAADGLVAGFPCVGLGGIGLAGDGFVCGPGFTGFDEPGFAVPDCFDSGVGFDDPAAGFGERRGATPPCGR